MSVVSKWTKPKSAAELGRLIQAFLSAEFGWGCGGGSNDHGADLDIELDDESVTILVGATDELFAIKRGLAGDKRFELLDADELAMVEACRAKQDADEPRATASPFPLAALEPSPN